MFDFFKSPPEIPRELDFLADGKSASFGDNKEIAVTVEKAAKRSPTAATKSTWLRVLAGFTLAVGLTAGGYWFLTTYNAPIPTELPQGDIFASIAATPSAVSFGNANPVTPKETIEQPTAISSSEASPAMDNPKDKVTPKSQPQSTKAVVPASQPAAKSETPEQDTLFGMFGANPFIDLTVLRGMGTASSSGMDLPYIEATGNRALPDIPRPAVSPDLLPAPGEIRTPAAPVGAMAAEATMGGIIKGADGNSIAIMGDGTVLSEGDIYKGDRRVTFIGGEGLQFDNGDAIDFRGQKQ